MATPLLFAKHSIPAPGSLALRFAGKPEKPAPSKTTIARLILTGAPKPDCAREILRDALAQWPEGKKARYFITSGGFAEADWPRDFEGDSGWLAGDGDIRPLVQSARLKLSEIVTPDILRAAKGKTDYLTIGIDVVGEHALKAPHAELVAVVNVNTGNVAGWTGKSYPTAAQNTQLVPVTDLSSHFMKLGGDRVMVLGCNDLNMFSPRVLANSDPEGERAERCQQMLAEAQAFAPNVILQHPHATDTPNIWRMAWLAVERLFPAADAWASAIRYFNPRGEERKPIEKVLEQTRSDAQNVIDLRVDTKRYSSRPSRYMQDFNRF